MGTVLAPLPEQCATTAKTSEWEQAGHKKGARALPLTLASGLSLKAWIPRQDRAGASAGANLRRSNGTAYPMT